MTIRILTVCTGNICRSPMAEQLLRARLHGATDLSIESAGTMALVGSPMDETAARLATEEGSTDADGHIARELTPDSIRQADLIFAMARDHRKAIVESVPRAVQKTFTIREFARIVTSIDRAELGVILDQAGPDSTSQFESAIEFIAGERGMVRPEEPDDDDVIDPYRRDSETYRLSTDQLVPAVDVAAAFIGRVLRNEPAH